MGAGHEVAFYLDQGRSRESRLSCTVDDHLAGNVGEIRRRVNGMHSRTWDAKGYLCGAAVLICEEDRSSQCTWSVGCHAITAAVVIRRVYSQYRGRE